MANIVLEKYGVAMVAPLPPKISGDLKIWDQNNWGGPEQKKKKLFLGAGAKFKEDLKF